MKLFDGHYYIEDVAAARICNFLSHENIEITDDQREQIARTIMGSLIGYIFMDKNSYQSFSECRKERWGL